MADEPGDLAGLRGSGRRRRGGMPCEARRVRLSAGAQAGAASEPGANLPHGGGIDLPHGAAMDPKDRGDVFIRRASTATSGETPTTVASIRRSSDSERVQYWTHSSSHVRGYPGKGRRGAGSPRRAPSARALRGTPRPMVASAAESHHVPRNRVL